MNKKRRRQLSEVHDHLNTAVSILEDVIDDEKDSIDNTPLSLRDSERCIADEDMLEDMLDVFDDLQSVTEAVRGLL